MASFPTRNEKGISPTPTAVTLGGAPALTSHSEELLTQISTELTEKALFMACCHMNPVPIKEKQTKDQGTQLSRHVLFTKTRGTDACSDRNRSRTKTHLLPFPGEKVTLPNSLKTGE